MKHFHYAAIGVAIIVLAIATILFFPNVAAYTNVDPETQVTGVALAVKEPELSHPQELWLAALEYCESRGIPSAINPNDLDGTPSYGAFQFKPDTFDAFTDEYNLPERDLMDADAQRAIVRKMIRDKSVKWEQQFPGCVKKIGRPPTK